jgi:hypothetical protein
MKSIAWTMTADIAMEFFKRCQEREAKTEQERVEILVELAEEGKMSNVVVTKKSKDEYVKDKARHFNVLEINGEDK